ncbi:MAG: hypothetical protein Q9182_007643, partial [Xanthomendoza sp. 2 TL-2023]
MSGAESNHVMGEGKGKKESGSDIHHAPTKRRNPRFRDDPMVTLEVGHQGTKFHAHKSLLCHISPFFEAAFNGPFKENSGSMELKEDEADTFELFIQWVYHGEVDMTPLNDPLWPESCYTQLTDLYVLADKYDIASLKNHVVRLLFATIQQYDGNSRPSRFNIVHVYANTVRGSPLRKFVVSYWAWYKGLPALEIESTWEGLDACPEFAFDMARALASLIEGRQNPLLDITNFLEPT